MNIKYQKPWFYGGAFLLLLHLCIMLWWYVFSRPRGRDGLFDADVALLVLLLLWRWGIDRRNFTPRMWWLYYVTVYPVCTMIIFFGWMAFMNEALTYPPGVDPY